MASRPTISAVTFSPRPLSRQRSFILMRILPTHVDLVPGSSRPELLSAQVTGGRVSRVPSRNLESLVPGMSSSNIPSTPTSSTMKEEGWRTSDISDIS